MNKKYVKLVPNAEMQEQLEDIVGRRKVIYILCEQNRMDELKERGKMKELAKARRVPVFCETNNTSYKSIADAAKQLGLSPGAISKCINGTQHNTKGYVFSKTK